MVHHLIFVFICFLIVSCDLPNEADNDCNDVNLGSAYIDECGRCVGGDTIFTEGYDKDECGECFGDGICSRCNDVNAINYFDIEDENIDNSLCIYDLCIDYLPGASLNYSCDVSQDNSIYQIGDQLRCDDIVESLDICYPNDCNNEFRLADLFGKITWIDMTASW